MVFYCNISCCVYWSVDDGSVENFPDLFKSTIVAALAGPGLVWLEHEFLIPVFHLQLSIIDKVGLAD